MINNNMDPIDPKRLILPTIAETGCSRSKKPPRHKAGEKFLKGPIPLNWITKAARLPGKALHVATAIWYLAGLSGRRTVKIYSAVVSEFGVSRFAKYRALAELENAGLVAVERSAGRSPVVSILEVEEVKEPRD